MTTPDPLPILYAAVAKGPTLLAELATATAIAIADGDEAADLRPLAARCLAASPPFHRLYTHTAAGRIYAFLIDEPLVFFAIADESLPRSDALLFLRRLRDAATATPFRRRIAGATPLCFQDELLPVLRRLVSPDNPPPAPPPASPPSDAPLTAGTPSGSEDGRPKKLSNKWRKKFWSDESESRMEIPPDSTHNADLGVGIRSARKLWRRHVWRVLLLDLIICCILFVIWLFVCHGFQCIAR